MCDERGESKFNEGPRPAQYALERKAKAEGNQGGQTTGEHGPSGSAEVTRTDPDEHERDGYYKNSVLRDEHDDRAEERLRCRRTMEECGEGFIHSLNHCSA